jgi:DNA-binding CsgD family transcriptional regulator
VKIAIEIDGYGPHFSNVSRWQFADNLLRQNHLVLDGWRILRFSYDDIAEKPRRCQQLIQQCMGIWFHDTTALPSLSLSAKEQQLVRLLVQRQSEVTPVETAEQLGVSGRHARTLLQRLTRARVLVPASGSRRIRTYKLNPDGTQWS